MKWLSRQSSSGDKASSSRGTKTSSSRGTKTSSSRGTKTSSSRGLTAGSSPLMKWVKAHKGLSLSIACHVVLILAFIISAPFVVKEYRLNSAAQPQIVQATVISGPSKAQIQREKRQAQLKRERIQKAKAEKIRIAKLKREKLRKAKIRQAHLRKERLKKQQQRLAKLKAEKLKKAQVQKQKLAAAKQKKARETAMNNLLKQLKAKQQAAAAAQQLLTERQKYIALVTQIIRSNWINQFSESNYQVTLKINLDPQGDVLGVSVVKTSGSRAFDQQAKLAVQKSSPFPVPKAKALQAQMKTMTLAFSNLS